MREDRARRARRGGQLQFHLQVNMSATSEESKLISHLFLSVQDVGAFKIDYQAEIEKSIEREGSSLFC